MKFAASIVIFLTLFVVPAFGQTCSDSAKEIRPQLSKESELKMSQDLEIAARNYVAEPTADNAIWYARRKGYLGRYKDAVDALTIALGKFPNDARMYRHRGHRYITLRCFDDAIRDLEKAAKLIKGKPDEAEPDGQPNAKNIPSTKLK